MELTSTVVELFPTSSALFHFESHPFILEGFIGAINVYGNYISLTDRRLIVVSTMWHDIGKDGPMTKRLI